LGRKWSSGKNGCSYFLKYTPREILSPFFKKIEKKKKKKGELWQKERGLDGASPLDKFFKSETGYRTILSNRFCKRSNISSSTVRKVRSDRKFKR
jgi:hypothetical protein